MSSRLRLKRIAAERQERLNIVLFAAGRLISLLGTSCYTFAAGLHLLRQTSTGLAFAVNLALGALPIVLLNPVAGVLADRLNRKLLAVLADCVNGLLLIAVFVLSQFTGFGVGQAYFGTVALTVVTIVYDTALEAALPGIVTRRRLMAVNSLNRIVGSGAAIFGPVLGGFAYAFLDIRTFLLANGATFLISAFAELFIDFGLSVKTPADVRKEKKFSLREDLKSGCAYLTGKKELIGVFRVLLTVNFTFALAISIPVPYILNRVLKLGPQPLGVIQGALPVGTIIGALFVKGISGRISNAALLKATAAALSVCFILTGLPPMLPVSTQKHMAVLYYGFIMLAAGTAACLIDIPLLYRLQTLVPDMYRGRVMSIGISAVKAAVPVALIVSGLLTEAAPAWVIPVSGGLLLQAFIILTAKRKF